MTLDVCVGKRMAAAVGEAEGLLGVVEASTKEDYEDYVEEVEEMKRKKEMTRYRR